jgi:hypothetical protein
LPPEVELVNALNIGASTSPGASIGAVTIGGPVETLDYTMRWWW